jgi:hypothetical protein
LFNAIEVDALSGSPPPVLKKLRFTNEQRLDAMPLSFTITSNSQMCFSSAGCSAKQKECLLFPPAPGDSIKRLLLGISGGDVVFKRTILMEPTDIESQSLAIHPVMVFGCGPILSSLKRGHDWIARDAPLAHVAFRESGWTIADVNRWLAAFTLVIESNLILLVQHVGKLSKG